MRVVLARERGIVLREKELKGVENRCRGNLSEKASFVIKLIWRKYEDKILR